MSSHGRRRRRAVDEEQLLALRARSEARRAKEDGVGAAAVVIIDRDVAPPPPVANFSALQLDEGLAYRVEALARAVVEWLWRRAALGERAGAERLGCHRNPRHELVGGARELGVCEMVLLADFVTKSKLKYCRLFRLAIQKAPI